jgi:hypothetical protein
MTPPSDPLLLDIPDRLPTARLLLRALQPGDGPALFAAVEESRCQLYPFLEIGRQITTAADAERLARLA